MGRSVSGWTLAALMLSVAGACGSHAPLAPRSRGMAVDADSGPPGSTPAPDAEPPALDAGRLAPDSAGSDRTTAPDAGSIVTPDLQTYLQNLCVTPDGPELPIASPDDLVRTVVGRWWLCTTIGSFQDALPVELTADGHWYGLFINDAGVLVRAAGNGVEGTWATAGLGQPNGLAYTVVGRGTETWFLYPTFLDGAPRKMLPMPYASRYVFIDPAIR